MICSRVRTTEWWQPKLRQGYQWRVLSNHVMESSIFVDHWKSYHPRAIHPNIERSNSHNFGTTSSRELSMKIVWTSSSFWVYEFYFPSLWNIGWSWEHGIHVKGKFCVEAWFTTLAMFWEYTFMSRRFMWFSMYNALSTVTMQFKNLLTSLRFWNDLLQLHCIGERIFTLVLPAILLHRSHGDDELELGAGKMANLGFGC